jgi:hypothetical protein
MAGSRQEQFDALFGPGGRLDVVTNDIAADYQAFINEAKTGHVSEDSIAKAEARVAQLEALGASKDNPVPTPPTDGGTGDGTGGTPTDDSGVTP